MSLTTIIIATVTIPNYNHEVVWGGLVGRHEFTKFSRFPTPTVYGFQLYVFMQSPTWHLWYCNSDSAAVKAQVAMDAPTQARILRALMPPASAARAAEGASAAGAAEAHVELYEFNFRKVGRRPCCLRCGFG